VKVRQKLGMTFLAIALGGCAGLSQKNTSPEELVVERAQARYDALMLKNEDGLKKAFGYTTPAYKTFNTVRQYNALVAGRGMWNEVTVREAICEESTCRVTVDLTYTSPQVKIPLKRPFYEKWIKIDDQWWIYHK